MFNNPNFYPYQYSPTKTSITSLLKKFSISDILNGTQKTLNIINQAIPIINQATPLWNNAKTLFKIANAVSKEEKPKQETKKEQEKKENPTQNIKYNEPVFFL